MSVMSASRPARCLFSIPALPKPLPISHHHHPPHRNFHKTPSLLSRRRPRFASIKASEMGLAAHIPASELSPSLTDKAKERFTSLFTPEQLAAIEAGEAAINPEDIKSHGRLRTDLGKLDYLDDFATTTPGLDRLPERGFEVVGPDWDWQEEIEGEEEGRGRMEGKERRRRMEIVKRGREMGLSEEEIAVRVSKAEIRDVMGGDGRLGGLMAEYAMEEPSVESPGIGRAGESNMEKKSEGEEKEIAEEKKNEELYAGRDPDGKIRRAGRDVGLTEKETFALTQKILLVKQVSNTTNLGKVPSYHVLAMAGNGQGRLGIASAKGLDTGPTAKQARLRAIRALRPVPRYEDRTIYGDIEEKVSATIVKLMARPPGFGLRCQHYIYEIARAAGIHDLAARVPRSRNPMNTIKATYQALLGQRLPGEIARGRGRKLVDVRRVYYAGLV